MFCKNCGFSVRDGAEYCQSCGKVLRESGDAPKKELRLPESARKEADVMESVPKEERREPEHTPEKKTGLPEITPEAAASGRHRCVRCGAGLPEGAVFCGNCGCRQEGSEMEPEEEPVRTEAAGERMRMKTPVRTTAAAPISRKRVKRGKFPKWILGLAAAAVIVVLAVVAVRYVSRGPFYDLQKAFEKLGSADSFKLKCTVTAEGNNYTNSNLFYIYDKQEKEIQYYFSDTEGNISNFFDGTYGVCNTNGIFRVNHISKTSWADSLADYENDEGEYFNFSYDEDGAVLYELMTALHEKKSGKLYDYLEDALDESDISVKDMEKLGREMYKNLTDKEVLEKIIGYEKTKSGKDVTYTFSPDVYELLCLYADILDGYIDDDVLEDFEDMLEEQEDDLNDMKLQMTISIEDGFLSEIAITIKVDGETAKIKLTVSDYDSAELPKSAKSYIEAMEECREKYE